MTTETQVTDLTSLLPEDTATIDILNPNTGTPTGWRVTLAGPAHAKTAALAQDSSRKALHREAQIEAARINGRKWKGDEKTPDDNRRDFVSAIVGRIVDWTPVKIGDETITFSEDKAIALLMRREMGSYLTQIVDYLTAETAFMKGSATK